MSARTGLVETRVAPPRLGRSFRWLLASSWSANIGDGLALAAGPLLVASQTDNAILVAMAALLQRLPWLLFGLPARCDGRPDRPATPRHGSRRCASGDRRSPCGLHRHRAREHRPGARRDVPHRCLWVFADTTSSTLLRMLVAPVDLGLGNSRFQAASCWQPQLVGPPLVRFLFAVGPAWPLSRRRACVALGVVLIARIEIPPVRARGRRHPHSPAHCRRHPPAGGRAHPRPGDLRLNVDAGGRLVGARPLRVHGTYMGEVGYGLLTSPQRRAASWAWSPHLARTPHSARDPDAHVRRSRRSCRSRASTQGWRRIVVMLVFGSYAYVWLTRVPDGAERAVPTVFKARVSSVYTAGRGLRWADRPGSRRLDRRLG